MKNRRFKIAEERHLALPHGLQTAPGAETMRLTPGEVFELDAERCQAYQRFIAGRVHAGDMIEVDDDGTPLVTADRAPTAAPVTTMTIPTAGKVR